jgi:hypothetical protein
MDPRREAEVRTPRGVGLILVIAVTAALVGGRAGWALRGDPEPQVRTQVVEVGVTPASCHSALEMADRMFAVASDVVRSIDPDRYRAAPGALRALHGTVRALRGPWAEISTECREA